MPSLKPIYGFTVTDDRLNKCMLAIGKMQKVLNNDTALQVLQEIGYGDCVDYGEGGKLSLDMTNLQYVTFAAALAAVAETGGKQELAPEWRDVDD